MSKVLIIGCGGVASVAIHKCCQVPEVFTEICIASRTKAKCDKLAAELAPKTTTKITTAQVDADKTEEVIALIKAYQPDLVMNIALPYQDLTIDLDCLDPSCFPGTGTPEAGGVSFLQLLDAIRTVTKANIVAADLNELAPTLDTTGVSTATACKVLRELLIALDKGWPGFQV